MLLPDVNVLVYAHREEAPEHVAYADWLSRVAGGPAPFALSPLVLSGFLRVVTNPRVFKQPTPQATALDFVDHLCKVPTSRVLLPGPANLAIFLRLCRESGATGKLVADAYHAALAVEHGCELVTADADFSRFPGLRWRHPLRP